MHTSEPGFGSGGIEQLELGLRCSGSDTVRMPATSAKARDISDTRNVPNAWEAAADKKTPGGTDNRRGSRSSRNP